MDTAVLSWPDLEQLCEFKTYPEDPVQGPTNAQARLRLFGQPEAAVRVTLYRDNHAWCPYCQKVWLWLEEKQIPYRVEKITMFCYGEKETWYRRLVPSGMLPAVMLDGQLYTESDDILMALEEAFGPLGWGMEDPAVLPLRALERALFQAWCRWLCYPSLSLGADQRSREQFQQVMDQVQTAIAATPGPYFLEEFGVVDCVFIPYVERMNASLFYYKGYDLRQESPVVGDWLGALETRLTYRGTQSDFHTHAHDLPPQMGGCWSNGTEAARHNQGWVDHGPWQGLPDAVYPEPKTATQEALARVLKHRATLIEQNPCPSDVFDTALRCALTYLITGNPCVPPPHTEEGLRYLRDRISVPRDMSVYAARHLRQALEDTAALIGDRQGPPIPVKHRRDQSPLPFRQG